MYRYRVVPFVGEIKRGFFSSDNAATVSAQLQRVIESNVNEGWEFYSVEKIGIEVKPGCLQSLMGSRVTYISFDQVVFRRGS